MKNPTLCAKSGNIYKGCRFQKHRCRPGVDSVGLGAVTVLDGPGAEACGGGTPFAIGHGGSRYRN
jgi:hypothetical protein